MKKIFNYIYNQAYNFIYKLFNEPITKREYILIALIALAIIRLITL